MKRAIIIRYLLFTILLFGAWGTYAQEPTDKEIGFDRELIKKELYENNPFIKKEFLDQQVENIRKDAVERYKLGIDKWFEKQAASREKTAVINTPLEARFTGCESFTFNDNLINPLTGWSLIYNTNPYQYTNPTLLTTNNATGTDFIHQNETRFKVSSSFNDNNISDLTTGSRYLRIGNAQTGTKREAISRTFTLNNVNDFIFYRFAIILQDPGHSGRPFFTIRMLINNREVECSIINFEAPSANNPNSTPGFVQIRPGVWMRNWSSNIIKPADFGAVQNNQITIEVSVSDCSAGGHFGYGYFDVECINEDQVILSSVPNPCLGTSTVFSAGIELIQQGYTWNVRNQGGTIVAGPFTTPNFTFTPTVPGNYTVELNVPYFTTSDRCNITSRFRRTVTIGECEPVDCEDCSSFNLKRGEKYIISGWVKEKTNDNKDVQAREYTKSFISLAFYDTAQNLIGTELNFLPAGDIIDGWQRVHGEFIVPVDVEDMNIALINNNEDNMAFFDDIRVNPFNGNLKSFVYDQETQKLMAELDENNYSTFYEYDKEGGLIRVKKETEKGIFTIQESRSSNPKKQ